MKKIILFTLCTWALTVFADVNGSITSIKDSDGNNIDYTNIKKDEVYTIDFEGNNIKDFHMKLGDETATVSFHTGAMPTDPSGSNVDVQLGSFTNGGTFQSEGASGEPNSAGKYISLWKGGEGINTGQFQIRFNSGTPGETLHYVFTSDGDNNPFNGEQGQDWKWGVNVHGWLPPTLISTEESIPTLSEWGVIILILLMLAMGMVFIYKMQFSLAFAGGAVESARQTKTFLFDKRLFAKVFGVTLIAGLVFLGLSYMIFGKITAADPFGTFVSAAIIAYMIQYMMLRRRQE